MNSISPNLNIMIKACEKASKIIIRDFGELENLQVKKKGPRDFVTKTDQRVEKILIQELSKNKKNYSFITEETGIIKNSDKETFWIIDPIDGTTNFLHGIPHFAISIALKFNNEISSGVIFDPIKNEIFYAEKNSGAYFNNQRIRVSKKKNINECLFGTGGKKEFSKILTTRKSGSAALDMAYVASGRCDGFWQRDLSYWDLAAGIILVKEAGGFVTDFNGTDKFIENKTILSANPRINEAMVKFFNN